MPVRRLLGTALCMAGIAAVLVLLAPVPPTSVSAVAAAQRTADTVGADALVVHLVGLLAWVVWGWGALGLALTATAALPGAAGALAAGALRGLLPSGARRAAALALGIGLGIAPPVLGAAAPGLPLTSAAAAADPGVTAGLPGQAVPDWPAPVAPTAPDGDPRNAIPDWPEAPAAGEHVVVRGDCLWTIAAGHLARTGGAQPSTAEVATAVAAWWHANAEVIGPDPDLLLPGQVLRPPARP
ncbi:LysM peptidoglycan-binding domain-containing protein [Blastococcus sp. SYSU DS0669]